jgi:hypothetical protein
VVHVLFLHGILAAARLYRPAIFGICSAFNSPRERKANTKLLQILTGCDCEIRRLTHSASESMSYWLVLLMPTLVVLHPTMVTCLACK